MGQSIMFEGLLSCWKNIGFGIVAKKAKKVKIVKAVKAAS